MNLKALSPIKELALLSCFILSLSPLVRAEITVSYDHFKDVTTVSIVPLIITGDPPQLTTAQSFRGKIPSSPPDEVIFQVYAEGNKFAWLACPGIDILADGTAVETRSLNNDFIRVAQIEQVHDRLSHFLIWSYVSFEEARKIAEAKSVRYRLCENNDLVYELLPSEIEDFRNFLNILKFGQKKPKN